MPKRRERELEAHYARIAANDEVIICSICDRVIADGDGDDHHLIPVHKGGQDGPKEHVHRFCNTKIHSLFTNAELAKSYYTPELLREHPAMREFIAWVSDKPSGFYMKNTMSRGRKQKQRR